MKRISKIFILLLVFIMCTGSSLAAGQITYQVKAGDTLWGIAQTNSVTVEDLKSWNNLESDKLNIGDLLIIKPDYGNNLNDEQADLGNDIYIVNYGDCLDTIANKYGINVEALMEQNKLSSTLLMPGQELIIKKDIENDPQPLSETSLVYTVQAGDCLGTIAQKYSLSVAQLKYINKLSTDTIYPGQVLNVDPALTQEVSRSGSVIDGSRLVYIASQYLGVPYRYGGNGPGGFDCSGFVQYIYKQSGYQLPRTAAQQYQNGIAVSKNELVEGDLVFFACGGGGIDHVGIFSGNNQFIHSSSPRSGGVIYSSLNESYYLRSYVGARRILR
jgi:cell wall-associated NlpC family hydrolase